MTQLRVQAVIDMKGALQSVGGGMFAEVTAHCFCYLVCFIYEVSKRECVGVLLVCPAHGQELVRYLAKHKVQATQAGIQITY